MTRALTPLEEHLSTMVQLAKQETPLGWEASIRIGPQGVSPWRYLMGFAHDGAPTSFLDSFLTAQAMPTAFKDAFAACLPWTASILFSVAPSRSDTELRVYQEYAADAASDVAMRGFKWPAARSGFLGHEGARMTNYSATPATALSAEMAAYPQELQAFLHAALRWQRTSLDTTQNRSLSSSAVLRSTERQGARDALSLRFTYMQQALSVCVAEVRLLALTWGYSVSALSQLDDMLHQVSDRLLNWVSVGLDTQGLPFISLYFTATEDDVLVAASHSHRRAA